MQLIAVNKGRGGVKRFIIISFILSITGHGLFFCVFRVDAKPGVSNQNIELHLITVEQLDYLRSRDVIVSRLPDSLSNKNPLWKDMLDIVGARPDIETGEEIELLEDSKSYNFQEIQIPSMWNKDLNKDIIPLYGNLFYLDLFQEGINQGGEYSLDLKNNIKMSYYLQGPVSSRRLVIEGEPDIDRAEVRARFRFWVTKDGRVNQVIIEEGSSFPLIDTEIINFIKTWRFSPVFDTRGPNYEWGVVRVRLVK